MTKAAVLIRGLKKNYNCLPVLRIDKLSVAWGEVLGLTGPNGAGKSTLLRIIALLEPPDAFADFRLFGTGAASSDVLATRRSIGIVFQDPFLFRGSVYDNIAGGLRWRFMPKEALDRRVRECAEMVGLNGLDRDAREISRGQAQRVALARALAHDPELLLLDEPLSAMDTEIRARLLTELRPVLTANNRATVLVTHNAEELGTLATRRVKLVDGEIVGTPVEEGRTG